MIDFGNLVTTLLTYYLPIDNPTARINVALAFGQAIGIIIKQCWDWLKSANIWRSITKYNCIAIGVDHPAFHKIILYYYKRHSDKMKSIELLQRGGEVHVMIEYMTVRAICDGDIFISMAKEAPQLLDLGDNGAQNNVRAGQRILFKSTRSVPEIDEYVKRVIAECSRLESNLLTIYNVNIEHTEKHRRVGWKPVDCVSNKTTANNIVSANIQADFYDDIANFVNSEASYNRRGISYRRGYIVTGIPGSGKSTLWESIANEYRWPVFRMDMSAVHDNSEVTVLLNSIFDHIASRQKHILLLEDLDRCTLFTRWRGNSCVSDDAILNMIESRGAHGRIIIVTGNNRERIRDTDTGEAMFRSGRIDRDIKLNYCTIPQIEGILRLYFEYDGDIALDPEIEITVADLNKIVQLRKTTESVIAFLNRFKKFSSSDYIEELIKTCDNAAELAGEENLDNLQIDLVDIGKRAKSKALKRRNRAEIDANEPKKPRGMGALEQKIRSVRARERRQLTKKNTNDLGFQIEELRIRKLKLDIERQENELGEQIAKYRRDIAQYNAGKEKIKDDMAVEREDDQEVECGDDQEIERENDQVIEREDDQEVERGDDSSSESSNESED